MNKFERGAHDIQVKYHAPKADHGQLGDNRIFDPVDWTMAKVAGAMVLVGIGLLCIL